MEELTQDTMPDFLAQLRSKLAGRTFTLHTLRGHTHRDITSAELSDIKISREGIWTIDLSVGGLVQPFSTYFKSAGDKAVVWNESTARSFYQFTERSVRVIVDFVYPDTAWQAQVLIEIQE